MYTPDHQTAFLDRTAQLLNALNTATNVSTLTAETAREEMHDLEEILHFHEWRYYVASSPILADYGYDRLLKRLEALEMAFPALASETSPTKRVGSDVVDDLTLVTHLTPMLSLDNSYNLEDLRDLDQRVQDRVNTLGATELEYIVEPKFDGGTIVLVYENDILTRAATRGNGTAGDDITHNARAIRGLPLRAAFSKFGIHTVELRGEALISRSFFAKLNERREAEGLAVLANPRNAATGVMRVKDPTEVRIRGLEAFVYQIAVALDSNGNDVDSAVSGLTTHEKCLEMLENLGFRVPRNEAERKRCANIDEVFEYINLWEDRRDTFDYETDGMVVKVNRLDYQARAGATSHHPRWAAAYKFKARQVPTRLESIEYQVGRTGAVTPVAKVTPVAVGGVMVSSVSLHNAELIKEKDIRLGDTVMVERAGEVIPYIASVVLEARDGSQVPITFPTHCPVCGSELVKPEKEAIWRCENSSCEAQILERLFHYVSKNAMNIDGLGEKQIERFYQEGLLRNIPDIYRLDFERIATMEGFGRKSVENLAASIEASKRNPIYRLLYGMGVRHIGETVSRTFAAEVERLQDLATFDLERLKALKDIGPKVAAALLGFFHVPENIALLDELEALGVNTTRLEEERKEAQIVVEGGLFSGKTMLFTGKLNEMTRTDAETQAVALGAIIASGVNAKLNILVVGEKAGSKLEKARALGTVEIMSESDFVQMVKAL